MPIFFLFLQSTQEVQSQTWESLRNASALMVIAGGVISLFAIVLRSQARSLEKRETSLQTVYFEMLKGAKTLTDTMEKMSSKLDKQHDALDQQRELIHKQTERLAAQVVEIEEKLYDRLEKRFWKALEDKENDKR